MLKRLITIISIVAALGQPALAQSAPWGDISGVQGAVDDVRAVFPGGQFPGGRLPPGLFPGGQFPGAQLPDGRNPDGTFPGGQFPPGTSTQQPDPRTYPYPYWLPKGKSTNRGVGRRYFLPQTSTSSVDIDITDGAGGSPPPTFSQPTLPVNIPTQRFTPPQIPSTFPGGRFPQIAPTELNSIF